MQSRIERLAAWAHSHGWSLQLRRDPSPCLPGFLWQRYPNIPGDFVTFTSLVEKVIADDDTACVLCGADFTRSTGLRWNEFELMSLDAARRDPKWQQAIRAFWDDHLPVFLSVKGEYFFFAVSMDDGSIVRGDGPEFEEVVTVADSFRDWLDKICVGGIRLT